MRIIKLTTMSVVTMLALPCPVFSMAQAGGPQSIAGTVAFEVSDGNCTSQTTTTSAGRNIVSLKLSSSKSQVIMLVTPGTQPKVFMQHTQNGVSERWTTSVMLPAGNYELSSSLGGAKCAVTVQ